MGCHERVSRKQPTDAIAPVTMAVHVFNPDVDSEAIRQDPEKCDQALRMGWPLVPFTTPPKAAVLSTIQSTSRPRSAGPSAKGRREASHPHSKR